MNNYNVYSKKVKTIFRIISSIAILILIISNTNKILFFGLKDLINQRIEFYTLVLNCLAIVLFSLFIIFPSKLGICSGISLLYGSLILVFEPYNNLGILLFFLAVLILDIRGYNKNNHIFSLIFTSIYIILVLSELRFGVSVFFQSIIEKLAYTFILFLLAFFGKVHITDLLNSKASNKTLDIQKYPALKRRDAEWLGKILNGKKYEAIAIESKMNLGSVKNRLKVIFKELGVGDKQGFLNKYSDYTIFFGEDFQVSKEYTQPQ